MSVVIEQVYFNHFKLLYLGISLLCQNSVSAADIALSQTLLDEYVKQYEQLYGLRHMSFNVHLLRHLPKVVEELGPLWITTCFMFEDLNGSLKHLVHGTQYAALMAVWDVTWIRNDERKREKDVHVSPERVPHVQTTSSSRPRSFSHVRHV